MTTSHGHYPKPTIKDFSADLAAAEARSAAVALALAEMMKQKQRRYDPTPETLRIPDAAVSAVSLASQGFASSAGAPFTAAPYLPTRIRQSESGRERSIER